MATTKTPWDEIHLPRFPKLREKTSRFDVVVIGGGITGLSTAYFLKRAGLSVCLLERDRIGHGDTGCTTAHLTYVTDLRLSSLVRNFGEQEARLVWRGGMTAIDAIEAVVRTQDIACSFQRVPGFLHAAFNGSEDETSELEEEAKLARQLGFDALFLASVPNFHKPGIRFADQAKFHPLAYLAGLARLVEGDGCAIHEQTEVTSIEEHPLVVRSESLGVECKHVVIATHVPLMGKAGLMSAAMLQSKLAPYSSYVLGAKLPHRSLPEASFWDTSEPYHYLRVDRAVDFDYVIFGGEDHKTGQVENTNQCFERLEKTLTTILPAAKVDRRWSGQVIETNDGLPYIGETAEHQFVATGFAGNGMTFGTLAGMMIRDAILERENPWQELFSVGRTKIRGGAWNYLKENIDYPYYRLKDLLTLAESTSTRQIRRGNGKILNIEGQTVACSRETNGKLHMVSAFCTHMGCLVRWNQAEGTWDCPCHGSRFAADGKVIAGPAESPLEKITQKPNGRPKTAKRSGKSVGRHSASK